MTQRWILPLYQTNRSENESAEVGKGDSVRVCTSFILLDQSDVTLQLYETFGAGSKTAETTLSLE